MENHCILNTGFECAWLGLLRFDLQRIFGARSINWRLFMPVLMGKWMALAVKRTPPYPREGCLPTVCLVLLQICYREFCLPKLNGNMICPYGISPRKHPRVPTAWWIAERRATDWWSFLLGPTLWVLECMHVYIWWLKASWEVLESVVVVALGLIFSVVGTFRGWKINISLYGIWKTIAMSRSRAGIPFSERLFVII